MSEKFNLENSNLPDATILVPVEVKKSSKVNKSKFIKSVGALAIVVSVPGALVALADNSSEDSILRLAPATLNSVPIDTTNTDPTTSSIVLDSTSTSVLIDTTSTTLTPDSTVPGDTTPGDTTTDPTVTSTTEAPVTTTPETTLPPELGVEFTILDNDLDNTATLGEFVTYNVLIKNLDSYQKVFNLGVGFEDNNSLGQLYNLASAGCGSPDLVDNQRNYELYNLVVDANGECSITFDASVAFIGGMMRAFSNLYPVEGTNTFYSSRSDIIYSR